MFNNFRDIREKFIADVKARAEKDGVDTSAILSSHDLDLQRLDLLMSKANTLTQSQKMALETTAFSFSNARDLSGLYEAINGQIDMYNNQNAEEKKRVDEIEKSKLDKEKEDANKKIEVASNNTVNDISTQPDIEKEEPKSSAEIIREFNKKQDAIYTHDRPENSIFNMIQSTEDKLNPVFSNNSSTDEESNKVLKSVIKEMLKTK